MPSALAGTVSGTTSVKLSWKDNDKSATRYTLLRSTDGVHFSTLTTLSGGTTSSYTDLAIASGTTYSYEVLATNAVGASPASPAAKVTVGIAACEEVHATGQGTSVVLAWGGDDAHAKNIIVQRSSDGTTFVTIATLAPGATTYTDTKLATATKYYYRIEASSAVASTVASAAGVGDDGGNSPRGYGDGLGREDQPGVV